MLFKCRPEGLPIPGRFPGPAHARGKWFTIDIHCHWLTEAAEKMVADAGLSMDWQPRHQFANELTRETNREQARRTRVQFTSVEKRLADMDLMGIDIQAITPSPAQTFYSVPADLGIATARVINDNIAEICGKHPDRFVGLGTVPFQAPELAVAELDRLHKSLGLRGIEIATNVAGADLSEPRFRPIFQRAEELGLTLFMHPTGFPEASRFRDHYFTNIIGNPLDTTVAVHHLIFGGVLQDCPNLKLVLSHGGGFLAPYSGRIDHAAAARPDTCTCLSHMPTTYLKRLYFDTIVYTHHQLHYLVEQYGADHVLMGTDYPADMGEVDPIGFIESAGALEDSERRAILGRNAARLLNITVPEDRR
ncbi:MAG TPA: amidohydrolase family protein [Stellaceae bacterium]|jgi:aminocarboxymuconate-semialdehyde decarboxylase|nr:amidohydrolase family protein [Stellaceae bacterium]